MKVIDPVGAAKAVEGGSNEGAAPTAASKSALSDRLMRRLNTAVPVSPEPPPAAEAAGDQVVPVSFGQQRLWLLDRLDPGRSTYNMLFRLRVRGPLDPSVARRCLTEIRRRHEVLRTTLETVAGEPWQRIHPPSTVPLPVIDLSGLAAAAPSELGDRLAKRLAARRFDLRRGPLMRATLLRHARPSPELSESLSGLLIGFHHVVFDGWSIDVFFKELAALYRAFLRGEPSPLPPLPIQFADYAQRQRQETSVARIAAQIDFWRTEIGVEPSPLELPTDRPRPAVMSQRGGHMEVVFPAGLTESARRLAGRCRTSPFFVLLGLFQVLLGRWAGTPRVLVGTPVANRRKADLHPLIGFLVNAVVVPGDVHPDATVLDMIGRLRQTGAAVLENQDVSFERLVEELGGERDLSRSPLFQVVFTMGGDTHATFELAPGVTAEPGEVHSGTAKWDLMMALEGHSEGLRCDLEYAADLFDGTTMRRLARQFECLAAAALAQPERRLGELPLLHSADRHQVVAEWNDTDLAYPREATVAELVAGVAAERPDAVALVLAEHHVTYGALLARARVLAARLRAQGVGPETLVAIAAERSIDLVVGLLAILEAGGAYLPLDHEYPPARLALMVEDSRVEILLTQRSFLPESGAAPLPAAVVDSMSQIILLDDEAAGDEASAAAEAGSEPPGRPRATAANLAYATYTSGSTGRPKAVMIPNRAVARLISGVYCCPPSRDAVHLLAAPISFDAATFEIWSALGAGGRVVVAPPGVLSLSLLAELLPRHRVSALFLTSGLFHQMVAERLSGLDTVGRVLAGGDVVPVSDVEQFLARRQAEGLPGILVNVYGPTESTTFATQYPMRPGHRVPPAGVPIGHPIGNTRAFVVDAGMAALPVGVVGALVLAGDGLARGYLGRPALTAERFVPDPLSGISGSRIYRTGDRARWRPAGALDFLGRLDKQVKLRGFRIELGEIETEIGQHPAVSVAHVVAREDGPAGKQLVAYVEPKTGAEVDVDELRRKLEAALPRFMVPSTFVLVERIPLTANGKVDRGALPAPAEEIARSYEAPRTELELQVAEIWQAVLGNAQVGLQDSFWDLGGHSLLATKVMARLQEMLGVDLPITMLFDAPRLGGFTMAVGQALLDEGELDEALVDGPHFDPEAGP